MIIITSKIFKNIDDNNYIKKIFKNIDDNNYKLLSSIFFLM